MCCSRGTELVDDITTQAMRNAAYNCMGPTAPMRPAIAPMAGTEETMTKARDQ